MADISKLEEHTNLLMNNVSCWGKPYSLPVKKRWKNEQIL